MNCVVEVSVQTNQFRCVYRETQPCHGAVA
jgi:hypothetical protein